MDFSNQYPADCLPPEGEYESRDALFTAIKAWAAPRGYTFRIGRSTKEHSKKHTVTFTCNRARPPPSEAKPRVRLTSSRGTGCQFSVLGKESYDSTRWFLKHRIGSQFAVHNHEPNVGLAAYLVPRRAPAPSPAPGDAPGASERAAAPLGAPRTAPASAVDYAAMATPEACYADFCLIPVCRPPTRAPRVRRRRAHACARARSAPAPSPSPRRWRRCSACCAPAGSSTPCTRRARLSVRPSPAPSPASPRAGADTARGPLGRRHGRRGQGAHGRARARRRARAVVDARRLPVRRPPLCPARRRR